MDGFDAAWEDAAPGASLSDIPIGLAEGVASGARSVAAGITSAASGLGDLVMAPFGGRTQPDPLQPVTQALTPAPMAPGSGLREASRFVGGVGPWIAEGALAPELLIPTAGTAGFGSGYQEARQAGKGVGAAAGIGAASGGVDAATFAVLGPYMKVIEGRVGQPVMQMALKAAAAGSVGEAQGILHRAIDQGTRGEELNHLFGSGEDAGKMALFQLAMDAIAHGVAKIGKSGETRPNGNPTEVPASQEPSAPDRGAMPAPQGQEGQALSEVLGGGAQAVAGDQGKAGAEAQGGEVPGEAGKPGEVAGTGAGAGIVPVEEAGQPSAGLRAAEPRGELQQVEPAQQAAPAEPTIVYHGSEGSQPVRFDKGAAFFSSNPKGAPEYRAGETGTVKPYTLNINNPLDADNLSGSLRSEYGPSFNKWGSPPYEEALIRDAKAAGYDGIVGHHQTSGEELSVAFDATQVRPLEQPKPQASPTAPAGSEIPQTSNAGEDSAHEQAAQASRAKIDELFKKLKGQSERAGMGFDTDRLSTVIQLAQEHLKLGYHEFKPWADEMVAKIGEEIRPYLPLAWKAIEPERIAYHGTPHDFEQFSTEKIGTGEGAQAFGHGLYFTDKNAIARDYANKLGGDFAPEDLAAYYKPGNVVPAYGGAIHRIESYNPETREVRATAMRKNKSGGLEEETLYGRPQRYYSANPDIKDMERVLGRPVLKGNLYKVELAPKPEEYLQWDKPLSEQSSLVRAGLSKAFAGTAYGEGGLLGEHFTGQEIYKRLADSLGKKGASDAMRSAGIRGIDYLAGDSRATTGGELLGVEKTDAGWVAKIRVKNRTGVGIAAPADMFTTSRPFASEAQARAWADSKIKEGTHNYVIFDSKDIKVLSKDRANAVAESKAKIDDLLGRLAKSTKAGMNLDPEKLSIVAQLAAEHIKLGVNTFAEWSKELKDTLGEKFDEIKPYLEAAWSKAQTDKAIAEAPKATGLEALDRWQGARDLVSHDANVQADRHEKEILATVPKRSLGQAIKEASETGSAQPKDATQIDRALQLYIDTKNAELQGAGTEAEQFAKYGGKFTPEQTALRESMLKLTPEQKRIGDAIVEENRMRGEQAQNLGVLGQLQEAYNTRLWDLGEGRPAGAIGKFTLDTARQKARSLESIYQGWAQGLELKVKGAVASQKLGEKQLGNVMADRSLMVLGEANGLISDQEHPGWVRLEHPGFTKFIQGGEGALEGTKGYKVSMLAEPELGNRLNKIMQPSTLDRIVGVKAATKAAEVTKASILFTSFFHHRAFLITHMFSTPDVFQAMRPIEAMKRGREAVQAGDETLRAGVRNGLTLGRIQDYDELARQEKTAIGAKIDKIAGVGQAARLMHAMLDQQQNFLFHKMSPALKANAFLLEMRAQSKANAAKLLSGEMTIDDVAKNAAKLVNDQFGGINLQREGRSPTAQHAFRLLALAPDWTETKIRLMANSLKPGADGAAYRASWARVVARAGAATILGNLVMSLFDDGKKATAGPNGTVTWEPTEDDRLTLLKRYKQAWDEGKLRWMDVDVTPILRGLGANPDSRKYISLVGHYHDPVKLMANTGDYIKHKGSVLTRLAADAWNGEDYKGARFTTLPELLGVDEKGTYKTSGPGRVAGTEKGGRLAGQTVTYKPGEKTGAVNFETLPSFLLNEAKSMTPIQVQNAASWINGEMDGFDAVTRSLGLMESAGKPPQKGRN